MFQMRQDYVFAPNEFGVQSPLGNIHSKTVYDRIEALQGDTELVQWLKKGVKFKYKDEQMDLSRFWAPRNNQSVNDDLETCQKIVATWEEKGFVKRVTQEEVSCVHPLSLSHKYYALKGVVKPRLCLDCSEISKVMEYPSIKLPEPSYLKQFIPKNSWLFSSDFEAHYFHFSLSIETRRQMSFKIVMPGSDEEVFFSFQVLPFGVGPAVAIVMAFNTVIIDLARRNLGLYLNIFIDDSLGVVDGCRTLEEASAKQEEVLEFTRWFGLTISWDKVVRPTKRIYLLGAIINAETEQLECQPEKAGEIQYLVSLIDQEAPLRLIAKIVGKLLSNARFCAIPLNCYLPETFCYISTMIKKHEKAYLEDIRLGKVHLKQLWNIVSPVPPSVKEELEYLSKNYLKYSGRDFHLPDKFRHIDAVNKEGKKVWAGDAGKDSFCQFDKENPHKFVIQDFTISESQMSSSARELWSLRALVYGEHLQDGDSVIYHSDSQAIINY